MKRGGHRPGAGRKKGLASIEAEKAREFLITKIAAELEPIADRIIEAAKNGDLKAAEYLLNQLVGKPKESMDVTSKGERINGFNYIAPNDPNHQART